MNFITAPAVVGIIFYTIYRIFELLVRRKERQMFIDKLDPEKLSGKMELPDFSDAKTAPSFGALKWGCLLLGLGLGLLVGLMLNIVFLRDIQGMEDWTQIYRAYSVAYGSSVLIFGGLGLLTAFLIEHKYEKK
jgi:hypothetical protein